MFTFPTLRSTLFLMAVWGVLLAVMVASLTSASGPMILGGILLGAFAGVMESQALRLLPLGLTNSTADFQQRRSAVLATLPGKLFFGAELLCFFVMVAVAVVQRSESASAIFPAFGFARHSLVLLVHVFSSRGWRANEV